LERKLQQEMMQLAEEMRFEEAQQVKVRYTLLKEYKNRSEVVSSVIHNVDVFAIETEEKAAYINFLHVTEGCITQAYTFEYRKRLDESDEDLLVAGILDMRERYKSESREVIVPFEVELPWENVGVTVPQKGEKRKLLGLSMLNVKQYKADRMKQADKLNPEQRSMRLLKQIQEELHLPNTPMHIECFDNSNISGTDAVAACVVFKGGKPEKKEYRKFNIKTVEGPDDYASMREVVFRRYHRLKEEGSPLPDLIITDGGKGQMEVVREVVEEELHLSIPIAGLAKDNKHRTNELLYGFPPVVIGMKTDSPLFHLLTRIQDEVHRFAITFHKDKRSKRQIASELDTIKGIGPTTKTALLTHFKSVKRIREASFEEVSAVVGQAKAKILQEHWK
jgi:excinuclease ABC subunit C